MPIDPSRKKKSIHNRIRNGQRCRPSSLIRPESTGRVAGLVAEDHKERAKSNSIASNPSIPSVGFVQCDLDEDTIMIDGQNQSLSSHLGVHKATGEGGGDNAEKRDEELAANNDNQARLLLPASPAVPQIRHYIVEEVITALPTIIAAEDYEKGKEREVGVDRFNGPSFDLSGSEQVQCNSAQDIFIVDEAAITVEIPSSPPPGLSGMHILIKDIARLSPNRFLNDTLIECGLKLWHAELRERSATLADEVHLFSPFFFEKLQQGTEAAKSHTKRVDIFNKAFLIVPIHDRSSKHWYLAIITNPRRIFEAPSHTHNTVYSIHTRDRVGWAVNPLTEMESNNSIVPSCLILIFDSLNHSRLRSRKRTNASVKASDPASLLTDFLLSEAEYRHPGLRLYPPSGIQVKVPQQPASSVDCGLYVLAFVETFMMDPYGMIATFWKCEHENTSVADLDTVWQTHRIASMRQKLKISLEPFVIQKSSDSITAAEDVSMEILR